MKNFVIIVLASVLSFGLMAQNSLDVKLPDDSDYVIANKADTYSGSISAASPQFSRQFSDGYAASCDYAATPSSARYYEVIPFYSTSTEALDISSTSTGGSSDMHFIVYCDPFDPLNNDQNIIAIDDDGGAGLMPAFDPVDNYIIQANTQYYLTISPWASATSSASYDISFGGDFQVGVVGPPPTVPVSNWAFVLIGLLAIGFVFLKFRK